MDLQVDGSILTATVTAQAPPKFVCPNFERMPPELKQRPNWVLWVPIWTGSKWTKRPIQVSGFGASTTNPKHWSSFEVMKQAYERGVERGHIELREKGKPIQHIPIGGVGFVFDGRPDEEGLVLAGVDFDGVIPRKGEILSFTAERVKRLGSYVEASVSRTGLHVIVKARPLSSGIAHGGVELYTSGRFFTMTGRAPEGGRIVSAPDAFAALARELQNQATHQAVREAKTPPVNVVPLKLPESFINAKPAAAFADLPDDSLAAGLETDLEEIRSATLAIPPSAIATEPEWMRVARALANEARRYPNRTDKLWEILDEVSRRAPGYDKEDNQSRWLRFVDEALNRENPITIATVFDLAFKHGWRGTNTATSIAVATPVNSHRAVAIANLPLVPRKREWLHGNDLMRGAVSMLVAPGARAKTTWLLTIALACASGRPILGAHVFGGGHRVLYLSAEDSTDEIALRLRAAMQHHGLSNTDVSGLHVIGADHWGLSLLRADRGAPVTDQRGWDALTAELDRIEPDVLIIDPLINVMGGVDANNNSAAALLIGQLAALSAKRRIAVMIAHHVAKGRDPTSAESALGAASFVNLCRIALGIEPLAETAAGQIGLPPWEAKSVFRVVGTKQNFNAPDAGDRWFRIQSVEIQNQQPPVYVAGDRVAVVEKFQPGSSGPAFPPQLIRDVLAAVDRANPRLSPSKRSTERYAAPVIAQAIAPHRRGQASDTEAKAVLDHIIRADLVRVELVTVSRPGGRSDARNGLVLTPAGKAAIQQGERVAVSNPPPQSPANSMRDDAGGDPHGSPATPRGCGGDAGCHTNEADAPQTEDGNEHN